MTPEQMATLLKDFGTPDCGSNKSSDNRIHLRRYNVIVRTKDNEVVDTYEMVSIRTAREIRKEAHDENMVADIIEDWTITYNDREINPQPIVSNPILPPKNTAMNTPQHTEAKAKLIAAKNMVKAQNNIARSVKNAKCEYHIFRIINKALKIDIQDTEAAIADFLIKNGDMKSFKIIYCGIAESWGRRI